MDTETIKPSMPDLDLGELISHFARRWYVIVSMIAAFAVLAALYTQVMCTPQYDSTAKIIVFGSSTDGQLNTNDISVSTYLTRDYLVLISDRTVLNEVIDDLNLNYSYGALKSAVSVNNPENTRIIEITVRTPQAELSQRIANRICVVAQQKMVELMGVDRVNIISEAYLPAGSSWPNFSRNVFFGALLGGMLSVMLLIILYYIDDKIKNEHDVERYLGLSVLGTIPYAKGRAHAGKRLGSAKK